MNEQGIMAKTHLKSWFSYEHREGRYQRHPVGEKEGIA